MMIEYIDYSVLNKVVLMFLIKQNYIEITKFLNELLLNNIFIDS